MIYNHPFFAYNKLMADNLSSSPTTSPVQTAVTPPPTVNQPAPAASVTTATAIPGNQTNLPQQLLNKTTQAVQTVVQKVENPEQDVVKTTFAQKETEAEKKRKSALISFLEKFWWFLAIVVVVVILLTNWSTITNLLDVLTTPAAEPPLVTVVPPVSTIEPDIIVSGETQLVADTFGWLRPQFFETINYYRAGEATSGSYLGATRYLVAARLNQSTETWVWEFWEMPDGTVFLDAEKGNSQLWLRNLLSFYLGQLFDTTKVTLIDNIEDDFPQTIAINGKMTLYRTNYVTDMGPYLAEPGNGKLNLDFSDEWYEPLDSLGASQYPALKLYRKIYNFDEIISQVATDFNESNDALADEYLWSGTEVIAVDQTGIGMTYQLTFTNMYDDYQKLVKSRETVNLEILSQELAKYTSTAEFTYYKQQIFNAQSASLPAGMPTLPQLVTLTPGFRLSASGFEFAKEVPAATKADPSPTPVANTSIFQEYVSADTASCSALINGKVLRNVTKEDLVSAATIFVSQTPLYRFNNQDHPFYQLAYDLKFRQTDLTQSEFVVQNYDLILKLNQYTESDLAKIRNGKLSITMPTFANYVAEDPILLLEDPWGKIVAIGEGDIIFLQECLLPTATSH